MRSLSSSASPISISEGGDTETSLAPLTPTRSKLRKMPPIPIRRGIPIKEHNLNNEETADPDTNPEPDNSLSPILASSLRLNHIRTRSTLSPPRLSISGTSTGNNNTGSDGNDGIGCGTSSPLPSLSPDRGKKSSRIQSKSFGAPFPSYSEELGHHLLVDNAKEINSPRFQALVRVTSGRRKITPVNIKSFSHELNSKGVRPFPVRKPRWLSHPEDIMIVLRAKFDSLKEEVDSDLGIFASDIVGMLERSSLNHPEWTETLEDMLVLARQCAMMSPAEFWAQCEGIVQKLDDSRQELPLGILKQVHTRILFILTRCTRLLQFYKEGCFGEDEHVLGLHQLSDLGVYSEQISDYWSCLRGKATREKLMRMSSHAQDPTRATVNEEHKEHFSSEHSHISGWDSAKSTDSTASRDRMASWKKFPSAAEKTKKREHYTSYSPSKESTDLIDEMKIDSDEKVKNQNVDDLLGPPANKQKICWNVWREQPVSTDDNSMICRICETSIPTVCMEYHSRICTVADRCDLKCLNVTNRLQRISEMLERILELCFPEIWEASVRRCNAGRVSTSNIFGDCSTSFIKENDLCYVGLEQVNDQDIDNPLTPNIKSISAPSCKTNSSLGHTVHDRTCTASSTGSITPQSPLLTPLASQIDLLSLAKSRIVGLENFQQIEKLLVITHTIISVNSFQLDSMQKLISVLDALKDLHQYKIADGLVVDTFGRRIEKLLQEKYLGLCGQIEDYRLESSSSVADEDSPTSSSQRDRTSIQDFEIIKPISRGAFGRVFLARKRITGDLFAIKVLKKADMIRKNAVESILAERDILISARNPFVVRFFYSFTCRENLYLVMEYLNGGDLYSLLRNLGCLEEEMVRIYIAEVVLALEYLHSMNVIHRDLKPDNLLIAHDGHIKLTDFGLSKVGLINSTDDLSGPSVYNSNLIGEPMPSSEQQTHKREVRQKQSAVGTPDYLAPEILLGMGHGPTADWWSVGIILFELLVGVPPFNAEHPQKIFDNVMNRDIPWPQVPEEMSFEAYDLIDKLLIENPFQRLGATGAQEVKRHPFFKNISWDTLARQKAAFIPSAIDAYDTSYFTSRYTWSPDEFLPASAEDCDGLSDSTSYSDCYPSEESDEEGDVCGNLAEFGAPTLEAMYSFSNFSFKNLPQLASINYDMLKSSKDVARSAHSPVQL